MASERPSQTAADYVTIVLSPVLIMGLIGSLVFFLLEVCYKADGPWRERLQWILFFFVFGIVLVARISMMGEIASRSKLYGLVLAVCGYLGVQIFVEYPPGVRELSFLVNLLLIGLIWWCADKLTWDCTNVDEDTDMSGQGLLQASGLEEAPQKKLSGEEVEEPLLLEEDKRDGFAGWWQRYERYRQQKSKKRTLGTRVVYFSLAALPIFGLGQALIPLSSPERRRFAFFLMMTYVACGIGLLLTTCFLGLRRYLRQKRLQMPAAMTATWLAMGATLLVGLLAVGAILPRPYAESTTLADVFDPAGSAKRKANRMAAMGDSPGEGEGQPGEARQDGKTRGDQTGKKGEGSSNSKDPDGKGSGKGEGKDGRGENKSDGKGGSNSEKSKANNAGKEQAKNTKDGSSRDGDKDNRGGAQAKKEESKDSQSSSRSTAPSGASTAMQRVLQRISPVLKWVVFAVLTVVVLVALFRGGLGWLANFTDWAKRWLEAWRKFWENLFGGAKQEEERSDGEEEADEVVSERVVPFRSFSNPFDDGRAERMAVRDLVRYTFRAVEAWAREHNLGREPGETAVEFLARLGNEVPALEAEAQRLGQLQGRAEYGKGGLPVNTVEQVRLIWAKLERVATAPLSA